MIGLLKLALQAKHIVKVVPVIKAAALGRNELETLFKDAIAAWDTDKDGKPDVTPEELTALLGRALIILSKHLK